MRLNFYKRTTFFKSPIPISILIHSIELSQKEVVVQELRVLNEEEKRSLEVFAEILVSNLLRTANEHSHPHKKWTKIWLATNGKRICKEAELAFLSLDLRSAVECCFMVER